MGFERDEKLMIAILAEVAAKSGGKPKSTIPVILDLSDPKKEFNYELLQCEPGGVFQHFSESMSFEKAQAGEPKPEKVLTGLSRYGHEFLCNLRRLQTRDKREKETLEIARKSSRTANWSFWIAVVAIIISLPAGAVALTYLFGGPFDGP